MLTDDRSPRALAALPDEALIDAVQRQTFRYFWDGAEAASGLAFDRRAVAGDTADDKVAIGGSGFGVMGAHIARREIWVLFQELFARFPNAEVIADPVRERSLQSNGFKQMKVRLSA